MTITSTDWIFLGILAASMLLGVWRGLVQEVLSLLSWVAAFALAQWLAQDMAQWLPLADVAEPLGYAVGFVVVFVAALFVGGLITFLIKRMITAVGLRPIDRVLGALFGALRGVVLLLAITVVVGMTPVRSSEDWKQAVGPRWATTVLASMKPILPKEIIKYLPEMSK